MRKEILKQLSNEVGYYYYDRDPYQAYYGVRIDDRLYTIRLSYADVVEFIDIYEYDSLGDCVAMLDGTDSEWLNYIAGRFITEYNLE